LRGQLNCGEFREKERGKKEEEKNDLGLQGVEGGK